MSQQSAQARQRSFHVLTLGVFLSSAAFFCVTPILPLHLSNMMGDAVTGAWVGAVIAASFFTSALVAPIWGALGDRFGPKTMLLRSSIGLAITYLLTGLAPTPELLLAARCLNGLMAGFVAAAFTIVAATMPKETLSSSMVRINVAKAVGSISGAAVAGFIGASLGFFAVFVVASMAMLVAGGLVMVVVPAVPPSPRASRQPLFASVKRGFAHPATRRVLQSLFLVTLLFSTLQPVIPMHLLNLTGSEADASKYVGIAFSFGGMATILLGTFWGLAADKYGNRRLITLSLVLGGLVLGSQVWVHSTMVFMASFAIYAGLLSELSALLNASLARVVPPDARNSVFGLAGTFSRMALAAGPLIGGLMLDPLGSHVSMGVVGAALICAALWLRKWIPNSQEPDA